ncbi:hypothetical protein AAII07_58435, partial [Microvirga sp. 0TCS3.31]
TSPQSARFGSTSDPAALSKMAKLKLTATPILAELDVMRSFAFVTLLPRPSSLKTRVVHDWLTKRPRSHLHLTPTSAPWLNMVECWISILTRRCLQHGTIVSTNSLKAAIQPCIDQTSRGLKP